MKIDSNPIFIDTNILVYATILVYGKVHEVSLDFVESNNLSFISYQIINEYFSAINNSRKHPDGAFLSIEESLKNIKEFTNDFRVLPLPNLINYNVLYHYITKYKIKHKHIYDLNIYLTMKEYNIEYIATRNEKAFKVFEDITVINPFKEIDNG